ncbi:MAG: methionine gamma-lyase family protein [Caldisericia bacterium]|nr:methionine gamma-lyase family protein [Caldisericia bacterium]
MDELIREVENEIQDKIKEYEKLKEKNFIKVIDAFREFKVRESDFCDSSGYGFGDTGRDKLELIFSKIFETEDSLVRSQISSGSHAISIVLFSILKPGDELLSITGEPYDTIQRIIGIKESPLSLKDINVEYKEVDLINKPINLKKFISKKTKVIFIQKSMGYSGKRKTLKNEEIKNYVREIREIKEDVIIFVDNCYGEFVEEKEPTAFGVDLIAGSMTKNPGGGITPFGGYIAGRKNLIEKCASLISSPGIGKHGGAQIGFKKLAFMGLYFAPHVVGEALKGITFVSSLLSKLNFDIFPKWNEKRGDTLLGIKFKNRENLIKFAQLVQKFSPIDSDVYLEPIKEDFFNHEVIMAAGTFTQGSSIEFSFDAPIKEPYIGYLQGGLFYEQIKYSIIKVVETFLK